MPISLNDRARGAFFGLAVGDALGTTLEFEKRDIHPLHTETTGGGPFSLQPGQWANDISMALALADISDRARQAAPYENMKNFFIRPLRPDPTCTITVS